MTQPAKRYKVLSVIETAEPLPNQQFLRITLIRFQLPAGYTGELRIPRVDLSPAEAKDLLEAEVARVEGIFALGS